MYNKELFEKYPYAFSHYDLTGEVCCEDDTNEPYSLDEDIPKGWSKLFWMCMEEIREPLEKAGLTNTFYFTQVKEKYGELCLYNNGATEEVLDIISKYEYLSQFICDRCGKPADYQTSGWIENICNECYDASKEKEKSQYHHDSILLDLQPCKFKYIDDKLVAIEQDYTDTWEKYLEKIK